jgi:hypothetical protein
MQSVKNKHPRRSAIKTSSFSCQMEVEVVSFLLLFVKEMFAQKYPPELNIPATLQTNFLRIRRRQVSSRPPWIFPLINPDLSKRKREITTAAVNFSTPGVCARNFCRGPVIAARSENDRTGAKCFRTRVRARTREQARFGGESRVCERACKYILVARPRPHVLHEI